MGRVGGLADAPLGMVTLETELEELEEVPCVRCGHGYTAHEDGGGHCRGILSNGPMHRLPCMCPGMAWIPAQSPGPLSYSSPPAAP